MNVKIKVGIIYGGESFEHEVSIMTAKSILKNIDRSLFDVKEIYIEKNGHFDREKISDIDIAFLAVHGPNCEDGKLQADLEKRGIKYTGPGVEASKVNMNKSVMHKDFFKAGLPIVKYLPFSKSNSVQAVEKQLNEFNFPIFIKPNNTGSSVGISKVESEKDLDLAIKKAFKYDDNIIIEEGIKSPREFEIGILGNKELIISEPGEILSNGEFYSYDTKYLNPFMVNTKVKDLSQNEIKNFKELAQRAYLLTDCRGYARIDFLMDKNRNIYINEISTLPGFTKISMFPKLMEASGISYKDLITKIIELGLKNEKN